MGKTANTKKQKQRYMVILSETKTQVMKKMPKTVLYYQANYLHKKKKKKKKSPLTFSRYLILTYTNEGETVFDGYMGRNNCNGLVAEKETL